MSVNAQDLVDDCWARYGAPAVLADVTRRLIALSVQPKEVADDIRRSALMDRKDVDVFEWLIGQVGPGETLVHTPADASRGLAPRTIAPLRARGIVVAYLIAVDTEQRIGPEDVERWQPTLTAVALEVEFERTESVRRRTVVSALLGSDEEDRQQATDSLLETYGLDSRQAVRVAVARITGGRDGSIADSHWDLTAGSRGVVTSIDHNLVAVLADEPRIVEAYCDRVVRVGGFSQHPPRLAVGGSSRRLDQAYLSYRQAKRALMLATRDLRSEQVLHWDRLGSWRVLLTLRPVDAIDAIDPRVLALVRGEDEAMTTLVREYLERDGDVAALAADQHVHRTTVYVRLKRLSAAYDLDWSSSDDRMTTLLGLRTAALHGVPGPEGHPLPTG